MGSVWVRGVKSISFSNFWNWPRDLRKTCSTLCNRWSPQRHTEYRGSLTTSFSAKPSRVLQCCPGQKRWLISGFERTVSTSKEKWAIRPSKLGKRSLHRGWSLRPFVDSLSRYVNSGRDICRCEEPLGLVEDAWRIKMVGLGLSYASHIVTHENRLKTNPKSDIQYNNFL